MTVVSISKSRQHEQVQAVSEGYQRFCNIEYYNCFHYHCNFYPAAAKWFLLTAFCSGVTLKTAKQFWHSLVVYTFCLEEIRYVHT